MIWLGRWLVAACLWVFKVVCAVMMIYAAYVGLMTPVGFTEEWTKNLVFAFIALLMTEGIQRTILRPPLRAGRLKPPRRLKRKQRLPLGDDPFPVGAQQPSDRRHAPPPMAEAVRPQAGRTADGVPDHMRSYVTYGNGQIVENPNR